MENDLPIQKMVAELIQAKQSLLFQKGQREQEQKSAVQSMQVRTRKSIK